MKIDIDLSEIFEDEEGCHIHQSVSDTIIQGIIDRVSKKVESTVSKLINDRVLAVIDSVVASKLEQVFMDMLNYTIVETSYYGGQKSPATTVKERILFDIEKNMMWKDGHWDSDKSPYTKTITKVIEAKLQSFSKEWIKTIDGKFMEECLAYATKNLRTRLGIKE